jgi:hypothetical protein
MPVSAIIGLALVLDIYFSLPSSLKSQLTRRILLASVIPSLLYLLPLILWIEGAIPNYSLAVSFALGLVGSSLLAIRLTKIGLSKEESRNTQIS